jgi:hypothetical protein
MQAELDIFIMKTRLRYTPHRLPSLALATMIVLMTWMQAAAAGPYRNEAFYFSMAIPDDWHHCTVSPVEYYQGALDAHPDHGVTLTWDGLPSSCGLPESQRRIQIMAGDTYWFRDIAGLLRARYRCNEKVGVVGEAPPGLTFARMPSATCRIDKPDGTIEVLAAARTGQWRGELCHSEIGATDYIARLQTRSETFDDDLARFRRVLDTVKVFIPKQKFYCSRIYSNAEFGFRVTLPATRPSCTNDGYQHDTGVLFYLDHGPNRCTGNDSRPWMSVHGHFNVEDWNDAHGWLIRIPCDGKDGKVRPAPPGLFIGAHRAAGCRIDTPDGWILIVAAWLRTPANAPQMIYSAMLHTTPARLSRDLARFRTTAKSIEFLTPQ